MMTRLVDAMQTMGLDGEAGGSGRWIRFPSGDGSACVVEAAWGNGYHVFVDDRVWVAGRDEPAAAAGTVFLDPVSAIEACLPRAVCVQACAEQADARGDTAAEQYPPVRHCDVCGAAVVPLGTEARALPARWGVVWFCEGCSRRLPAAEIDRRAREIALRGVPPS